MSIAKLKTKFADGAWIKNVKDFFTKINEIIDNLNDNPGRPYLVYTALLSQAGTDDPTVTILENTLGEEPSITYQSDGNYWITLVGKWTIDKTAVFTQQIGATIFGSLILDNDTIIITTESIYTGSPVASNGLLVNNLIEIRVYP
jgi:hypothetical protein